MNLTRVVHVADIQSCMLLDLFTLACIVSLLRLRINTSDLQKLYLGEANNANVTELHD